MTELQRSIQGLNSLIFSDGQIIDFSPLYVNVIKKVHSMIEEAKNKDPSIFTNDERVYDEIVIPSIPHFTEYVMKSKEGLRVIMSIEKAVFSSVKLVKW